MKISKLHLNQYRHLENLDFDFTYPKDFHIEEKRGKPLDKICFIGQSATGKTSLLELIYEHANYMQELELINNKFLTVFNRDKKTLNGELEFKTNDSTFRQRKDEIFYNNKIFKFENIGGSVSSLIPYDLKKSIFYFKANLISENNIDIFTKNPVDLFEKYSKTTDVNLENLLIYNQKSISLLLDDEVKPEIWLSLLAEILQYRKKFNQKMSELIHKGLLANQNKLSSEFKKWQKDNPNKLEEFAEKFNPILEKLNLEIDIIDTEFSIPIKNKKNEEIIPIQNTSTGTKGLLLSFLPLYKLNTKDSIILIDEPERSLYPNMQMELMEHYQDFAKEAQFIIATHSPFVAASFEPEERFILYFDEDGKVAVRRGSSPIGDDPNDILYNDFGIDYINKYGKKVYNDYLEKKRQLLFEKNKEVKQKLQNEIESIGDKYNF